MDRATMTELDGTSILEHPVGPEAHRRYGVIALAAVAICLDLLLRLAFLARLWDAMAGAGFLPTMLIGLLSGPLAVLVPLAFVLRSPDAWATRRLILLGLVLLVASELGHSATDALLGLSTRQPLLGSVAIAAELISAGPGLERLAEFVGIVGTLLFAIGLSRVRLRRAAGRTRGVIAAVLLVGGLLALASLRPFFLPPIVDGFRGWWWVTPALLAASELAWLCQAWVIFGGWLSVESPRRPWVLAAFGTSCGLVSLGLVGGAQMVGVALAGPAMFLASLVGSAGGVLFLAAVADGLGSSQAGVAPAA